MNDVVRFVHFDHFTMIIIAAAHASVCEWMVMKRRKNVNLVLGYLNRY